MNKERLEYLTGLSEEFPYNTPCHTGTVGPISDLCRDNYSVLNVVYVTRPYFTRHGDSKGDWQDKSYMDEHFSIDDKTNIPNDWQGEIKYRFFNSDEFEKRVEHDFSQKITSCEKVKQIAMTCASQAKRETVLDYTLVGAVWVSEGP